MKLTYRSWLRYSLLVIAIVLSIVLALAQTKLISDQDTVLIFYDEISFSPYKKKNTFEITYKDAERYERGYTFHYGRRWFVIDVEKRIADYYHRRKFKRKYRLAI